MRSTNLTGIRTIAFVVVVAGIHYAQSVLLPLAIAALLAFVLTPIVRWLEGPLRSRLVAVVTTIGLTGLLLAGLVAFGAVQLREFVHESPRY